MTLFFQVAYNAMSAKVSGTQDFFHLSEIVLLQSKFEEIISIVHFSLNYVTLSIERVHLVFHELNI